MKAKNLSPKEARPEEQIFNDLEILCCSPGYIHAIAYICWRDNFIRYSGSILKDEDLEHQYSSDRLLRSEISTLIGLMVKGHIDASIPAPDVLQKYIDQSQELLHEMHMSLQKPWLAAIEALAQSPDGHNQFSPFSTAGGLREPIFYGGDAAYNFQYEELAKKKYMKDNDWLKKNFNFTIDDCCIVSNMLGKIQNKKIHELMESVKEFPPDQWAFLPAFEFCSQEIVDLVDLPAETVEHIIAAFTIESRSANSCFSSLSDFNATNAAPIIKIENGSYILLQHYSLLEALYEAPFFWMADDKTYYPVASEHRGQFAEQFLAERLTHVFGAQYVYQNVNIYKGKNRVTEADVLVVYGDRTIVFQVKSKRLTIEARKGNDLQLKEDFKKAISDSYKQALRFSEAFIDKNSRLVLASGENVNFTKRPSKFFPVCVVSDHFPALAAQVRQFLNIKTTNAILSPIITDVFFFDVLSEILDTPLQFLNYFALRARFDEKIIVNQELTTLGYHLANNLWIDDKYNMANLVD